MLTKMTKISFPHDSVADLMEGPPFHILDKKKKKSQKGEKKVNQNRAPSLRSAIAIGLVLLRFHLSCLFFIAGVKKTEKMGKVTAILVPVVVCLICR